MAVVSAVPKPRKPWPYLRCLGEIVEARLGFLDLLLGREVDGLS